MAWRNHLIIWILFPTWYHIEAGFFLSGHQPQKSYTGATASGCPSGQIYCRSGGQCISLSAVCRNGKQCSDGSDEDPEICKYWVYDTYQCSDETFYCRDHGCQTVGDFCNIPSCSSQKARKICEMVAYGRLKKRTERSGMALTEELVNLVKKAVNTTTSLQSSSFSCPMFYTQVGDVCLSFFSPAKIPWAEARQFCLSIKGDLLSIADLATYEKLLQYMGMLKFTTDYWIGGRFDLDANAWTWVTDDTPMPLGSPYWATRYSVSSVPRSPPHTDPSSPPEEALPGAPCYNYLQAPAQRKPGWCAAMTYEHYYYFTDEECQDNRSPLCILTQMPSETPGQRFGNPTQ